AIHTQHGRSAEHERGLVESEDRSKYSGGPERDGGANSDGAPPRHEDRARDRIAPTRSGREVGRADRRHRVVAAYRARRADRPPPSRLRRPPGAWRNRPRLGLPRRRDSRGQRVIPMRPSPKSLTRRPINSAAAPHGRTAAASLEQNDPGATNGPEIGSRATGSAPDRTSQVSDRLAVLAELSIADLRLEWRRLFRADPPRLSRDIMTATTRWRRSALLRPAPSLRKTGGFCEKWRSEEY